MIAEQPIPAAQYTETMSTVARRDIWGVNQLAVYDEGDFSVKVAYTMVTEDPTLATGWAILRGTLLSHFGSYYNEDTKMQEFVTNTLENTKGWWQSVRALLTAPLYGFSTVEETWVPQASRWVYSRLRPIHPTTIDRGFKTDDDGELLGVTQRVGTAQAGPLIPIDKLIVWSFGDDFGEQPTGQSLLKPAYRHYYSINAILKLWNSNLELGPRPLIAWPVGPGEMMCPEHGVMEPATQVVTEMGANITDRSLIAFIQGEDGGTSMPAVLANEHIKPEDYLKAVRYHSGEELKAMLVPRLLVEEAEFGTRAQAQVQYYGPFVENVRGIQTQAGPILIEQLVRRLIEVNFGPQDNYGEWKFKEIDTDDAEMLANVLRLLFGSGIELTEEDHKRIRSRFPELLDPEIGPAYSEGAPAMPDYEEAR